MRALEDGLRCVPRLRGKVLSAEPGHDLSVCFLVWDMRLQQGSRGMLTCCARRSFSSGGRAPESSCWCSSAYAALRSSNPASTCHSSMTTHSSIPMLHRSSKAFYSVSWMSGPALCQSLNQCCTRTLHLSYCGVCAPRAVRQRVYIWSALSQRPVSPAMRAQTLRKQLKSCQPGRHLRLWLPASVYNL